jgi:hypothetical protein
MKTQTYIKGIKEKIYKAYEKGGVSAACDLANQYNIPYKDCTACMTATPALDDTCLVCGQVIQIGNGIKVYAVDTGRGIDFSTFEDIPDDEFIKMSMKQGFVWTLKEFEESFNMGDISDEWIIRILKIDEHLTNGSFGF